MSFFERLVSDTAAEQRALFSVPQIVDGLAGRISRETYIAYLAQAFHHVSHTVPLMRAAQTRMGARHDRFKAALEDYIAEETGHERWILNDIAHAGGDPDAVERTGPSAANAAMVGFAYDYVATANPMGLFGMIYVLEGTSIALASQGAEALARGLGLGPDCFSYLASHGALDQEHMAFFRQLMGEVSSVEDQDAIITVAREIFRRFAELFRTIPHQTSLAHAV